MPRIRKKPAARSHILRCARKSCKRTSTNVKNVPRKLLLAKSQADLQTCRALHSNCETLRFCSVSCLRQCKKSTRTGRRGARCGLNKQQLALMLKQGIQDDKPWLAASNPYLLSNPLRGTRRLREATTNRLAAGPFSIRPSASPNRDPKS